MWAERGTRPRAPRDTRYERACIFGAVCPARDATAALVMPRADTSAMNAHLAEISKAVAPAAYAVLVMDGAGWHGSTALHIPDNITILTLPPYAPELNPVENIWAWLRANRLAIPVFDTCENIIDRVATRGISSPTIPNASDQSPPANMQKRSIHRHVGIRLDLAYPARKPQDKSAWG
ncbi:IS630 family transposase [Tropicimonas sp.]|uniref:IS630 family transposase n=1 Tax=Tropicimonas sp. TaxID=2067044 RepID=UPI003A86D7D8